MHELACDWLGKAHLHRYVLQIVQLNVAEFCKSLIMINAGPFI